MFSDYFIKDQKIFLANTLIPELSAEVINTTLRFSMPTFKCKLTSLVLIKFDLASKISGVSGIM